MAQTNPDKKQHDNWLVELVRITAFPSPGLQIDRSKWWSDIVGEPPESQLILPKKDTSREEGPFGNGRLILETQPARIDWVFSKLPDDEALGDPLAVFEQFTGLVRRWFDVCGALQRLAFGSILGIPVNSQPEGYDRLRSFLKSVELDAENSSDFLYQINRPRAFEADGFQIKVNRLSKWSVSLWQMLEIRGVTGGSITSGNACRLELDLSTDGEFAGELPKDLLTKILDVLIEFGLEISQRGDVP